jgi:hypothetical protein
MAAKKEKDQKFIDEVYKLEEQAGGALAGGKNDKAKGSAKKAKKKAS